MPIIKTNGVTRLVIIVGNWAIKIPNFTCQHNHFLLGCYANWTERHYTKTFEGFSEFIDKVSPTVFCSYFGLVSIQRKVTVLDRDLTDDEQYYFRKQTTDIKKENFGFLNGKLVCIDYASIV